MQILFQKNLMSVPSGHTPFLLDGKDQRGFSEGKAPDNPPQREME